mmetsp:Transcript_12288/g.12717  ORF Transcript_12288/g.12717 Transcript_12288/m.12717 type:complete len:303 (+) Transcript_12288:17-925(+)|eukprot:CAMPEP_0170524878 /NCGR_PEP_ID=MMETSP0209-20121228/10330_1 /TAXON_ID=665100 ORGANISM="Litonotus pictus, Strain P1" /NCGR_SAMPLE_ID=MMETSP0209 /ASSEMBLY_ACC=CAM_ASM_000301 /LENGTH=302 /DNA_ID=CAMNT_0010813829 /DNA_START=11 /DNA_END=919 /DNA_ORIENTATION=-
MESTHKGKKNKVSATETASLCNNISVGVDGSDGSHNAVELIVQDYHRKGLDKLTVIHISDSKHDHDKGHQFNTKFIFNHYNDYLKKHLNQEDYEIVFEERKENESLFEQVYEIASSKNANLLVIGFRGVSGNTTRPDNLTNGIKYLVHKPLIPCLVVKEKVHREYRTEGGFKWLVCIESAESKSFKAFLHILRYVDAENDIIHGFSVDMKDGNSKKVEEAFKEQCKKNGVLKSEFSTIQKEEKDNIKHAIHTWVEEHLRNENHFIDFIVLGYNPQKYNFNKEASNTTVDILKDLSVNVFFDH